PGPGPDAYLRELGWREFSHHLLFHNPDMESSGLRSEFERMPWRQDPVGLERWQEGLTGYPLVDAGMRELWTTGWMHNRVRMVAASFLTKHLLIDWRLGADWFLDTLVDADRASNSAGWQWVAGCGSDAAPYFRIFNPVAQSQRFDPSGQYLRTWLPELQQLPDRFIHVPWQAPLRMLTDAGVRLGENYPHPMVDHVFARKRALEIYRTRIRSGTHSPPD
ncbi:MAG: FAD-binding domain-containing protein, partial [Gammaproteobacteria bacterium]|nr:FAD-binding domain-containing protein [Gammaproteobacteria bacterium]